MHKTKAPSPIFPVQIRKRWGWLEACLLVAILALLFQAAPQIIQTWRDRPRAGHQTPASFEYVGPESHRETVQYLLYLPEQYSSDRYWPLLLFLHGGGPRGDAIENAAKEGPAYFIARGKQLPMIVLSPLCGANKSWDSQQLLGLLDHLEQSFPIDRDRIYIAGSSMGGFGTWKLIADAPDRFAAAIPVAAGGDAGRAELLTELPIWAFHGAKDQIIPLERGKQMVDAVQAQGGHAKLTIFDDQGHNIEKKVFADDEIYNWLMEKSRGSPPPH